MNKARVLDTLTNNKRLAKTMTREDIEAVEFLFMLNSWILKDMMRGEDYSIIDLDLSEIICSNIRKLGYTVTKDTIPVAQNAGQEITEKVCTLISGWEKIVKDPEK